MSEENLENSLRMAQKEWAEPIRINGRFDPSESVCFTQSDTTQRYFAVTPEESEMIRKTNDTKDEK